MSARFEGALKKDIEFRDFIVEILSPLGVIRTKAMFGGHGIYCNELFVAIIVDGTLFFKTNAQTRPLFIQKGSKPFIYENKERRVEMSYYEAPVDAIDSSESIAEWLNLALQAARSVPAKKRKA